MTWTGAVAGAAPGTAGFDAIAAKLAPSGGPDPPNFSPASFSDITAGFFFFFVCLACVAGAGVIAGFDVGIGMPGADEDDGAGDGNCAGEDTGDLDTADCLGFNPFIHSRSSALA